MNNYFRLLLVGSTLIILLGLFNNQSEEAFARNQVPAEIELVEIQFGFMPVALGCPSPSSVTFQSTSHNFHFSGNSKLFGIQITKGIYHRFISIETGFMERKPKMICKTGQFLHLNTDREVPSHI